MRRRTGVVAALAVSLLVVAAPAHAVNDPAFDKQWGMTLIGAPTAWATGRGAGITIAVVDTGVHLTHEDLASKILPGKNILDPTKPPQDDDGHGTHVAGIAAALTDNGRGVAGVAPDAKILPVKVLDSNGTGNANDVAAGITYAADQHAQIINLSLGDATQSVFGPAFDQAVEYAWSKGSICVIAAGNNYFTGSGFTTQDAVVVSAVDRNDQKPDYSSGVGQSGFGRAKWGIAAPGGGSSTDLNQADLIFSTWWDSSHPTATNYYAYDAGTSMAAPHVSGALAILRGLGLSPIDAINRVLSTAKDLGTPGDDNTFGHGRLDVAKAVAGLGSAGGGGGGTATTSGGSHTTTTRRTAGTTAATGGTGTTATPAGAPTSAAPTTAPVSVAGDDLGATAGATPKNALGAPAPVKVHPAAHDRPWLAALVALVLITATGALGTSAVRRSRTRPG